MIPTDLAGVDQAVATGALPGWDRDEELVVEAHRRHSGDRSGDVADYIPILGAADPELFGLAVVDATGGVHDAGDAQHPFSIQSISKMFVYALAIAEHGHERVRDIVGVNNTGLSFNSVMALELNSGHPMNPMVNAGAIATTALMPGAGPDENGRASATGCPPSQGANCRWMTRCTTPRCARTSATAHWDACSAATDA